MNIFTTKILSILGVFLAFIVIGLGAWTRLADAGLGCPDWPGCVMGLSLFQLLVRKLKWQNSCIRTLLLKLTK